MVEHFKRIKKNLKKSLSDTDSLIKQGFASSVNAKYSLEQARIELTSSERSLKTLDRQWNLLSYIE